MIRQNSEKEQFKQKLRDLLVKEESTCHTNKIAKNANVYVAGDKDDLVYFIEQGQIKVVVPTPRGKERILAIHGKGDIFGELCIGERLETAKTMTNTELKTVSCNKFLMQLSKESLLEEFVRYLAMRLAEQQQVIANLVTVDREQRLGKTLLHLAKSIGTNDSYGTVIYISHKELSEMIGTTPSRVGMFMQRFRNLGLVEMPKEHYLIIAEQKLSRYLTQAA